MQAQKDGQAHGNEGELLELLADAQKMVGSLEQQVGLHMLVTIVACADGHTAWGLNWASDMSVRYRQV